MQKLGKAVAKPQSAGQVELMRSIEALTNLGKLLLAGDLVLSSPGKQETDQLPPWLKIRPIETLETLASRLQLLSENNAQFADDLLPIANDLIGLRRDIADLFEELKRER